MLQHLRINGGNDYIEDIGFKRIAPRWLGGRPDLLTVGGEAINETNKWSKMKHSLTEHEIRLVVARVVETAVIVCMNTHIYSFGPDLYLQCTGGPIGMRFTASLASIVMKQWDKTWVNLLNRENIDFDMFIRYVDDCRLFMRALNPGWTWKGTKFEYDEIQAKRDEEEGITYIERTTREMTKALCSLTDFLRFTGEDCTMFVDNTLPTLDTSLWVINGQIKHKFFEKPTVGNKVLSRDTALPVSCLWSSLLQETVRRLLNCSFDLEVKIKQDVLSRYAIKLINSGHSVKSARILLVQGTVKYLWKVEMSELPPTDKRFQPLYLSKTYNEETRQVAKYQAKMSWFKNAKNQENDHALGWRSRLTGRWKGSNVAQRPVLKEGYSTVLNVPNTKEANLARRLIKGESRLAKMTNYNVKITEKSGIQLCRLFQRIYTPRRCFWDGCPVCKYSDEKKSSKCRVSNVVYEAKCLECVDLVIRG